MKNIYVFGSIDCRLYAKLKRRETKDKRRNVRDERRKARDESQKTIKFQIQDPKSKHHLTPQAFPPSFNHAFKIMITLNLYYIYS